MKRRYFTNLTDAQYEVINKFLDWQRKRKWDLREIINAVFYLISSGCQWRNLPSNYPPWQTVYWYFRNWIKRGVWSSIYDFLHRLIRIQKGKDQYPTVGLIDSQSCKTSIIGGSRGYDAGKKINGRKRHLVVDTLGFPCCIIVHSAKIQYRNGAKFLFNKMNSHKADSPFLNHFIADGGYSGKLVQWVTDNFQKQKWTLEIIKKNDSGKFEVLPQRWIVERSFAWLSLNRRFSRDYEKSTKIEEALIEIAFLRLLLCRIK